MDEFSLIDHIVEALGERSRGRWVTLGPGDDAALIQARTEHELVASIDTLVGDVHFPATAPPRLIGYRALMVALSDLAAMAALPRYVLVALTLEHPSPDWVRELAQGMSDAAESVDVILCGGNLARGSLSITVSAHGDVPEGAAVLRSRAQPGDLVYVTGALGGAGACVREAAFSVRSFDSLTPSQVRYYRPQARFDQVPLLRAHASAAIDISDGLVADLAHVARVSGVGIELDSGAIPVHESARLEDALYAGDDYEIAFTSGSAVADLTPVGSVVESAGIRIDGQLPKQGGYVHFQA